MKNMIYVLVCVGLVGLSLPSSAHRFSTSFFVISADENDRNTFDWQWRLVRHDLEMMVPPLKDAEGMSVDMRLAQFIGRAVSANAECQFEVLPMKQGEEYTYAGQSYVHIKGRSDCGVAALTELSVAEIFNEIDDHKVILSIEPDTNKHVLSKEEPSWVK